MSLRAGIITYLFSLIIFRRNTFYIAALLENFRKCELHHIPGTHAR
jgi:hypothetical protein